MRTKLKRTSDARPKKRNCSPNWHPGLCYVWIGFMSLTFPIIYVGFVPLAPRFDTVVQWLRTYWWTSPKARKWWFMHAFSIQGVALARPTNRESIPDARSPGLMEVRLQYAASWHFRSNEAHVPRMIETKGEVSFLFLWSLTMTF